MSCASYKLLIFERWELIFRIFEKSNSVVSSLQGFSHSGQKWYIPLLRKLENNIAFRFLFQLPRSHIEQFRAFQFV